MGGNTNLSHGNGLGTIFKLTTNGLLTTLAIFNGTNGSSPTGPLVQGNDGNLYGETSQGGDLSLYAGAGAGTIFKITTNGTLTTLVIFNGFKGVHPIGGLTHISGFFPYDFYGATTGDGNGGTLFSVSTDGSFETIYDFDPDFGEGDPEGGVTYDNAGSFYVAEGPATGLFGRITRFTYSDDFGFWGPNGRVDFENSTNGMPIGNLTLANDGNLYGTTFNGGSYGWGTVYRLTPATQRAASSLTPVASFNFDSGEPYSGVTQGSDGNFYGTSIFGGDAGNFGTIFKMFIPPPPLILGITSISNSPVLFWPASATNSVLQMTTNLLSGNWVTVTNGIPYYGVQITNLPSPSAFRLQ